MNTLYYGANLDILQRYASKLTQEADRAREMVPMTVVDEATSDREDR